LHGHSPYAADSLRRGIIPVVFVVYKDDGGKVRKPTWNEALVELGQVRLK